MGLALAEAAFCRGAEVTVIHGPLPSLEFPVFPAQLHLLPVRSAREMHQAVLSAMANCDIAILCAAVADYAPSSCAASKIKKQPDEALHLCLERTPDILATLGSLPAPRPFLVGFAAESDDLEENAALKLKAKHCDIICANDITRPGCGFAVPTNCVTMFFQDGTPAMELSLLSKDETAVRILDQVVKRLPAQ
jgi:phosphopantothenoylcysteine decarboxylase/phosphopantothenate--cysteine ligase